MGRKSGSWITASGYSILEVDREEIIDRLWAGETLKALALEFNTCHANMHRWVKKETDLYQRTKSCILIECNVTFPFKPGKKACCRLHIKRYNGRGDSPGEVKTPRP